MPTQPVPFEGCTPAPSSAHAAWIIDDLRGREGVAFVVPNRFQRCVRVHHELHDARWADAAPEYLVRGTGKHRYPFPELVENATGAMGDRVVDRLVEILLNWSGKDPASHYGLWIGWGDFTPAAHAAVYFYDSPGCLSGSSLTPRWFSYDSPRWPSQRIRNRRMARLARQLESDQPDAAYDFLTACPTIEWWAARAMWLFDGPVSAVRSIGSISPLRNELRRRSPQWWWSADRSWFVANEIDWPWSYVAGPASLIERLLADDTLETAEVEFTDRW